MFFKIVCVLLLIEANTLDYYYEDVGYENFDNYIDDSTIYIQGNLNRRKRDRGRLSVFNDQDPEDLYQYRAEDETTTTDDPQTENPFTPHPEEQATEKETTPERKEETSKEIISISEQVPTRTPDTTISITTTTVQPATTTSIPEATTITEPPITTEPATITEPPTTSELATIIEPYTITEPSTTLEPPPTTAPLTLMSETIIVGTKTTETILETYTTSEIITPTTKIYEDLTALEVKPLTQTTKETTIEDTTLTSTTDEAVTTVETIKTETTTEQRYETIIETTKTTTRTTEWSQDWTDFNITEQIDSTTSIIESIPGQQSVLNLPALMDLIANLTGEFETNLTKKLNETLHRMSLPTCGTPTFEPPTTSEYDANYTGSIVAKCFVCGLDVRRVPRQAHCADAFAGDFLPLVPVDPTAKGHISKYRKYCKYSNIPGYAFNSTQPRAIFGRWSGGCAVRWIDLSGIYTQRVCRNRLYPTMGRHFASKRMAKLEKTLWNVDNGCIVSPMATLVPLSRGISLYARFHACVCTGNWCNTAQITQCIASKVVVFMVIVIFL